MNVLCSTLQPCLVGNLEAQYGDDVFIQYKFILCRNITICNSMVLYVLMIGVDWLDVPELCTAQPQLVYLFYDLIEQFLYCIYSTVQLCLIPPDVNNVN